MTSPNKPPPCDLSMINREDRFLVERDKTSSNLLASFQRRLQCPLQSEDLRVSLHIHEAVAAHVEGDDFPLTTFLALQRLVDRAGDAVRTLRSRQESLGLNELPGAFEHMPFVFRVRDRVDETPVPKQGQDRGTAVVPEAVPFDGSHLRFV